MKAFDISEQAKSRSFIQSYIQSGEVDQTVEFTLNSEFQYELESDRVDNLLKYLSSMKASVMVLDEEIKSVIEQLGNKHLISYFLAQQRLFVLVVEKQNLRIEEINIADEKLNLLVHRYKENPNDISILETLGELLLPKKVLPKTQKHIYISPDKFIGGIALASLRLNSKFLVERISLSLIPSASALVKISNRQAESIDLKPQFIVLGDPGNDLPAARQEVLEIASALKVPAITGTKASFSILLQNRQPEILHLATHSGTNYLGPWLRFAETDIASTTILNQRIRPRLAMLASCGSGAPHTSNLWGSLGGAFLSSGTPAVVATLWSVEDQVALEMMRVFYKKYFSGSTSAEALRLAQKWAIKEGMPVQQWATFTLMGVPVELSKIAKIQSPNIH